MSQEHFVQRRQNQYWGRGRERTFCTCTICSSVFQDCLQNSLPLAASFLFMEYCTIWLSFPRRSSRKKLFFFFFSANLANVLNSIVNLPFDFCCLVSAFLLSKDPVDLGNQLQTLDVTFCHLMWQLCVTSTTFRVRSFMASLFKKKSSLYLNLYQLHTRRDQLLWFPCQTERKEIILQLNWE